MPDLSFEITAANLAADMITPAIAFDLQLKNRLADESVRGVLLRCQIQIEVARRRYSEAEQKNLHELFDEPSRWGETLRPMTWANISLNVPAFDETTIYPVTVPCTFDLSVATSKYFHGVTDGDVPLTFLFSGSVFYEARGNALQIAPIAWNKEARFRMPVRVWKDVMDQCYPDAVCVHLRRDVFDELYRFKMREGLTTFEEAVERMLLIAERERPTS